METNTMTRYHYDENSLSTTRRGSKSCNLQIFFAYLLSVIASILVVGGVYLSYIHWDKMWFILSIMGIMMILIGSCLYYRGNVNLYRANEEHIYENRPRTRRRYRNRGLSTDQLMPTAPPLSQSRSVSQFSLNMIPQYFSTNQSEAIPSNATNTPQVSSLKTFSQILNVNGQSYLILPLSGEQLSPSDSFPLQNIVVKLSEDNKVQTSKDTETNNEVSSESKKINREEQSCQTDGSPKEIRKANNCYRDVQMQTLSNSQLEQTATEVTNIQTENSQSSRRTEPLNTTNVNQFGFDPVVDICSTAGPSHMQSIESQPLSIESYESSSSSANYSSANTESDRVNLDSLIDFNDDNNACTSQFNRTTNNFDVQTEPSCSGILLNISTNETSSRAEEYVESDCFNSFSHENVNEDEIDDSLSTPPPSYEEVVDEDDEESNDETPIVVDYGTL